MNFGKKRGVRNITRKVGKNMNTLKIKELSRRVEAMTEEEKEIMAKFISDEILFSELKKRSIRRRETIKIMDESLRISKEWR